jgi:transaldolase
MINNPASFERYKICVEQARFYDRCSLLTGADKTACQMDKALVNVGAMMLENVSGRVSTELDPRLAHDTPALVARGRQIMDMYKDLGVGSDRVILRMPATWEAIQAAAQLEADGIATQLVLVYSFAQGAAAAAAGASIIQPNVGKLDDWYASHPGVPRDPSVPREARAMAMAGYGSGQPDPGVLLVNKLYCYCKRFHPGTRVMASGIRTKAEALALAGCDFLVIGPKVMAQLAATPTLEGYNDSLRAGSEEELDQEVALTAEQAAAYDFDAEDLAPVTAATFSSRLELPGRELLAEGLARLVDDAARLEPFFLNYSGGQE